MLPSASAQVAFARGCCLVVAGRCCLLAHIEIEQSDNQVENSSV